MQRLTIAALVLAACGGTTDTELVVEKITPDFGPLSGGTRVVITGQGFFRNGAPPNRVVIGDTEAPLAAAADDSTLEVTIPPAEMPGTVPVLVFNRNGSVVAEGKFRYSMPPTITAVSPANVPYDSITTTVTVTGTGFMDEGAGVPIVDVGGGVPVDVKVTSDTTLTFVARPGTPLSRPTIKVTNARGVGTKTRGFRYIPSTSPGLIAFARSPTIFAIFFDPVAMTSIPIPHVNAAPNQHVRGSFIDAQGDIFAIMSGPLNQFQGGRANMRFGRLDFETQNIVDPVPVVGAPITLGRSGTMIVSHNRDNGRFGIFDPVTGITSQGNPLAGIRGGIAFDANGNAFWINSSGVSTFNVGTGTRGAVTAMTPNPIIIESRFLGGVLYGLDRAGTVHTINTGTGATAPIMNLPAPVSAMEVFQP